MISLTIVVVLDRFSVVGETPEKTYIVKCQTGLELTGLELCCKW
jgi:hypothetical protein